jgi:uncharacterized membrane protein YkoI
MIIAQPVSQALGALRAGNSMVYMIMEAAMDKTLLSNRSFRVSLAAAFAVAVLPVALANADDTEQLVDCLEQVHEIKHTDNFVKVEYLSISHNGDPAFEIEARDAKGEEWEFMCEADDGDIYEIEQEANSASDPLFKKNAKINEQQASQTVTELYPGTVKEVEYEIEANGDATYEIDVVDDKGTQWKVEVDAASGDILETQVEKWQIGEEPTERTEK